MQLSHPPPLPPANTAHQTMTAAMFEKTICRKCTGLYVASTHAFDECTAHQIDMAMLADKKRNGYQLRKEAQGMKDQINDKSGAFK